MKNLYIEFLKKLIVFTAVIAVLGYLSTYLLPPNYVTPAWPYLFVFFFSVTLIVHNILLKVSKKRAQNFINIFMLLTFGKLIFYLSIILAYALINREDSIPFIITFFILYVLFTIFEVALSLSHTKAKQKSSSK